MKKLIIACCAVLAIGCGMMAGGWAAGGQLYSSYYDSELHPFSESARDAADFIDRHLHYHSWWADGWHSGWLPDGIEEFVDDTVDGAVDDALDSIDTDWMDGWLEQRQEAIAAPDIPIQSVDTITRLDFTLSGSDITIESGSDFDLSGDFTVSESKCADGTWDLTLLASDGGATITLPYDLTYYNDIDLTIADALVDCSLPLHAEDMSITVAAGELFADELQAHELELDAGAGAITAYLTGAPSLYRIQGKASMGSILLNDEELAGGSLGTHRYDNRKEADSFPRSIEANAGAGTISLYTLE